MYTPPAAKNGVYFTKNLTAANRTQGEWLLGYYFRASKISKAPYYPVTNFTDMLAWMTSNYPTYIESLGEQLQSRPSDVMIKAMQDTAAKGYTDYPRPAYFNNNLTATYSSVSALGNGIADAADSVLNLGKGLVVLSIVGVAVFLYIEIKGGKNLFKAALS